MTTDRKSWQASETGMWHSARHTARRVNPRPCRTCGQGKTFVSRQAGITLIEVLVVMGIMTLVVSAIAVASFAATRKAQIRNTETLLQKLAQGLAQYKQDHRMYVPADSQYKTYPLWQALDGEYDVGIEERYKYSVEGDTYEHPRTGEPVQRYLYQDAWKMQLFYQCDPPYQRFLIKSSGPDLEAGGGDDIIIEE